MTCKKKRLKCDETHPHCHQCAKRNVKCEGYKKDFKWRSFEEASFNPHKNATRSKKPARSLSFTPHGNQAQSRPRDGGVNHPGKAPNPPSRHSPTLDYAFASAAHAFRGGGSPNGHFEQREKASPPHLTPGPFNLPHFDPTVGDFPDGLDPYSLPNTSSASNDDGSGSGRSAGSTLSSSSPHLPISLLLEPGTDLHSPPDPSELRPPISPLPYQPANLDSPNFNDVLPNEEEFDEEIIRQPPSMNGFDLEDMDTWTFRQPSPIPSEASSTSSRSSSLTILAQPKFTEASPEMLARRFDRNTCGILSVKDGLHENPWRTLIWPLGRDSPALYHAINSMVAFHGASDVPDLRVTGMAHMTQSIKRLSQEISNMNTEASLATSLALAFSEGWDHHTSTGIQHLKGAKFMVKKAVAEQDSVIRSGILPSPQEQTRLKFLCNTFVYMDVIARLTSLEEAHDLDLGDLITIINPITSDPIEVDPLMGCAVELFPLIGRVANLIQRVRKTATNSLQIVSEANDLKEQLQQWQPPATMMFERPEDTSSEVQHSIQTAEAYTYATLLYLHQAVPEIPSESSSVLARCVLMRLASVPISSRAIIVQIYPLLAAGCEVTTQEDRHWVLERWRSMINRLRIGNVNRCVDIVQEVWLRRDAYETELQERLLRRYTARGMPNGDFMAPMLNSGKRKAHTIEASTEAIFFDEMGDGIEDDRRPMKRRMTFGPPNLTMPSPMMGSMPMQSPGGSRRMGDLEADHVEPEYTVRGKLHWLGVMADQDWEGMLYPTPCCCGHRLLTRHAVQYFLDDCLLLDADDALSLISPF